MAEKPLVESTRSYCRHHNLANFLPQVKSSFSDVPPSSTQLTVKSFPVVIVLHIVPRNAS